MITILSNGVDDIAQTLYPSLADPQFVPGNIYYLSSLRILYTAGSTSATVTLSVDHRAGELYDFELMTITAAGGGGANINLGIDSSEAKEWYFICEGAQPDLQDGLKVAQTLGTSDTWSMEAAFINAKDME